MKKLDTQYLLALSWIAIVVLLSGCGPPALDEAVRNNDVQIEARGAGLVESITATITNTGGIDAVTIPAGMIFRGGPGTQSMMVAKSVVVHFQPGQTSQTVNLETYCINRFLDVPESGSVLVLDDDQPGAEHPLRRLATCLENKDLPHDQRQIAMWVVSDDLWDLTRAELAERIYDDMVKKIDSLDADGLVDIVSERLDAQAAQQLKELINEAGVDVITDQIRTIAWEEASDNVQRYVDAAAVLQDCGMEVTGKVLFQD